MKVSTSRVRELRRKNTAAEKIVWRLFRNHRAGLKFRRQFPIGDYVVDFYCFELRLAVELDGSAHAQPSRMKKDRAKDAILTRLGIRVLQLPNGMVTVNPEDFIKTVRECRVRRQSDRA